MNTSPILAADSFPSPATANPGAAADSSAFHQVLQQMRPAAAPAEADLLAGLTAIPRQSGAANASPGAQIAKIKKEDTVGQTSIGANQDTKAAVGTSGPKTEKARTKPIVANPIAVPVVAPSAPAPDPSAFSSALPVAAKAQQSTSPQPSDAFSLEPTAIVAPTVAPADVSRGRANAATIGHTTSASGSATDDEFSAAASGGRPAASCTISPTAPALVPEPATRTISSTAVASASNAHSAKSKVKPQPAISPGKGDEGSVSDTADEAESDRSTPSARAAARENIVAGSTFANPSVLRSSAEVAFSQAPRSARTGPQMAPLSSSATPEAQPKGNAIATSGDPASLSAVSAVGAHPSGFQSPAGQPTWVAAAITPDASQATAAQSAGFAAPSPISATAAPLPQVPVPTAAIPLPPPVVDSGQLRVTANNSELKISVQLPELGKVEVRAVTAHDVTTAHLTAFRHDALPVFAAERTGLEQALKSRDVVLGSLNAHAQNSQAQGQSPGQQRQQGSASAHSSNGTAAMVTAATISATTEASNAGFLPDYSSISVRA